MEMEMDGENLMHKILITLRGVVQYNCKPNPSHDCTLQIMVVRYVTLRQQNFPSKLKKSFFDWSKINLHLFHFILLGCVVFKALIEPRRDAFEVVLFFIAYIIFHSAVTETCWAI